MALPENGPDYWSETVDYCCSPLVPFVGTSDVCYLKMNRMKKKNQKIEFATQTSGDTLDL